MTATRQYLSPGDLAELLGVPVSTIYGWNAKGSGPRRVKIGLHVRYRIEDVEEWLAGQEVPQPDRLVGDES